jgi:hypothetical protein
LEDYLPGGKWFGKAPVGIKETLFDHWFPGCGEFTLRTRYCEVCGFMCYAPRPGENDLRVYWSVRGSVAEEDLHRGSADMPPDSDRRRAERVYRTVRKFVQSEAKTALDIGGFAGALMLPFMRGGYKCSLVDPNRRLLPGVEKLGERLEDIEQSRRFSVAVCSHVLEHVGDPVGIVKATREHLEDSGTAYFEVPLEIWRSFLRIDSNPVWHVNYFCRSSLVNTLSMGGMRVLQSRVFTGNYGEHRMRCIWAVAEKAPSASEEPPHGPEEVAALITPSFWAALKNMLFVQVPLQRSLRPVLKTIRERLERRANRE